VINVGSGTEVSIGDLANSILKIMHSDAVIQTNEARIRPQNSEVERLLCNSQRARSLLGWEAKVDLEEGLTSTIEWIKENLERYKASLYNV
jgi:dTDP-glucose 4,6-dehydratase